MEKERPVGLFDLDGSLADYEGKLRADLRRLQAPGDLVIGNLWDVEQNVPHMEACMHLIKSRPGWWQSLPPMANGIKVFRAANEIGFNCQVLSVGPKRLAMAWKEKLEWCQKHLGEDVLVTITRDKGLVYGRFLYDDFPEYAISWLKHRKRGLVIMPVTESNGWFNHPQVLRWNGENFSQVQAALQACYKRTGGV